LEACFVEGPRNAQVGDFLRTLHFNLQSSKERKKLFVLELEHNAVQWPEHIDVDLSC
jgi:hypothetical protein